MAQGQVQPAAYRAMLDDLFRRESARIVATLMRLLGDLDRAEEILQETLVAAIEHWSSAGAPENPAAWITAVAKNRAIDHIRRARIYRSKREEIAREQATLQSHAATHDDPETIPDDRLRLIFICCHPDLPVENRVALTLRLIGGLSTPEIARSFLVPEATVAQRIVRAKRAIGDRKLAYAIPNPAELPARLSSVLSVIYLIFNEGYAAMAGSELTRTDLTIEALRLGTMLCELMPAESEPLALLALMELQASRHRARADTEGNVVLLADQDRSRWDHELIRRGLDHLQRAQGQTAQVQAADVRAGIYHLQAAIARCHATAATWAATNWREIADLYARLQRIAPSPIVELNRAIAVSMVEGPAAGLAILDAIADAPALREYHLLPATRADFLRRMEQWPSAAAEYRRALAIVRNDRERDFLRRRLAECESHTTASR